MKKEKFSKKSIFFFCVLLVATLGFFNFTFAQTCPSTTTVTGTTVTFAGELTDIGGDTTTSVWFEYGQTTSYGQKTSEQTLTQTGLYCTTVSGLSPCTTYHYRAVARNTAGTSYGENKTFTTSCSPVSVDIKANNSDGPINVSYGSSITLSWTSTNASSCYASGDWSGSKSTSGSESTGNLTSSKTYTLTCSGTGGSATDSVTINVSSPSLSVSLSASPSSGCPPLPDVDLTASVSGTVSGNITYFFDCTNDGIWEKIYTYSGNSYTAYNLCNYSSIGNYTPKVRVERGGLSAENTTLVNVYSCYSSPTVDIKANGSDGPITIPYNTAATLTWTSTNATSCYASNSWSGSKSTSGSESTGNLTSSKTYTLTCSGTGGSTSDSVTVYIGATPTLTVKKFIRNLSDGTGWLNSVSADPTEVISFSIQITAGNSLIENVILRDTLPEKMTYRVNSLKMDGISLIGDIFSGLNIGNLSPNQTKTITFDADLASPDKFAFGQTKLINTVLAYTTNISNSDTAEIIVSKKEVAGVATGIPTGLTNNIFFDSFLLPLMITLAIIWVFKSHIIKFEEWLDKRKRGYQEYKSKKLLQLKIKKIKIRELLKI